MEWLPGGLDFAKNTWRLVLSSTEAECNGLVQFAKENKWERELHESLNIYEIRRATWVSHDNQSAIKLTEGIKVQNKRSKHFGLEFDWLREHVALGEMKLSYCDTDNMLADVPYQEPCHGQASLPCVAILSWASRCSRNTLREVLDSLQTGPRGCVKTMFLNPCRVVLYLGCCMSVRSRLQ